MRPILLLLTVLLLPSFAPAQLVSTVPPAAAAPDVALTAKVTTLAREHHGQVAVYAINLHTGDVVALAADTSVKTASVIKLALLWEAMQQIRAGRAHWSDRLTLKPNNQTDGSGVLDFFDTPLTLTLKDVLTMMVIVSDNTATNLAIDALGLDTTNREMGRLGLQNTWLYKKIGKPASGPMPADQPRFGLGKTTAREMASLMERIVDCRLDDRATGPSASGPSTADREICKVAIHMLRSQLYRDGAPRYLETVDSSETGSAIASKTGALDAVRNDVDAVATKRGMVILSIFTWDNADQSWSDDTEAYLTTARIAKIIVDTWSPQGLDAHLFDTH